MMSLSVRATASFRRQVRLGALVSATGSIVTSASRLLTREERVEHVARLAVLQRSQRQRLLLLDLVQLRALLQQPLLARTLRTVAVARVVVKTWQRVTLSCGELLLFAAVFRCVLGIVC